MNATFEKVSKFKKAIRELDRQIIIRFRTLIVGALTFVCALRWNNAIKSLIDTFAPTTKLWISDLLTAFAITVFAVIVIYIVETTMKENNDA